ncbi:outer membrane protein TolC [Cupriavidus gilardii J11]|uniref:Outer membrane protein TolC n=1 Tax=Cupriavidus gilardii J11 TaxID=936133 RepID=A0A562BM04_9BURK|nr:TolC family protein [Cupriavidus gilardii]TWG85959.1 outer membrane protein TolC [Cupriavidus gilardii J11]
MIAALRSRGAAIALALLPLAGCASFSADGGFGPTADAARERLGQQAVWARGDDDRAAIAARTRELLAEPLSIDAAVQLALLNSSALQARFAELGVAEADYVQATRLPNPGFSFSRTTAGDTLKIDRAVTVGLMNLLALPFAARIEQDRFAQTRLEVADAMLRHAFATRRAYIEAVAAEQSARYAEQVRDAAQTGALFARDLARAGNVSRLDHAREQAFYAEAATRAARARERAVTTREALTRHMGLWGSGIQYRLPDRLPDLPAQRPAMDALESHAIGNRLDLQAGWLRLESLARSLGLTRATRFVNVLEVGYLHNSESGSPRETGYEIGLEIPLFDWGGARVARAEAVYLRAANELADAAIAARSQVRDSHASYQIRYDIARHYRDEVVPLRKRISDEALLRYNGMLISVFELLTEAREQIAAVDGYLDALRDFWLARVGLEQALGGGWAGTALSPGPSPASGRGEIGD